MDMDASTSDGMTDVTLLVFVEKGLFGIVGKIYGRTRIEDGMAKILVKAQMEGDDKALEKLANVCKYTGSQDFFVEVLAVFEIYSERTWSFSKGEFTKPRATKTTKADQEMQALRKRLEEMEIKLKKAQTKPKRNAPEFSLEQLDKFETKHGDNLSKWMREELTTLQEYLTGKRGVIEAERALTETWEVMHATHIAYGKRYGKNKDGGNDGSSEEDEDKGNKKKKGKGKEKEKSGVYWRGKYKFRRAGNGQEYYVTSGGSEYRTDRAPPGQCDGCGAKHWRWECDQGDSD
jgi:hypothetical protein